MLKSIKNIEFVSKGHRGVVYFGELDGKKVALKLELTKSKAICRIENESRILKLVNRKNIGPKLLFSGKDFLVMEFVEGERIIDFLEKADGKNCLKVVRNVLKQCFVLDSMKIDKKEMKNPYKHVLVDVVDTKSLNKILKVVMIDFDRARKDLKPSNVTAFCSFLGSKKVSGILIEKGIKIDAEKLFGLCRVYKKDMKKSVFDEILKEVK